MPAGPADSDPAADRPLTVDIGEIAVTGGTSRDRGLFVADELVSRRTTTTTIAGTDDLARTVPTDRAAFDPGRGAPRGR